MINRIMIFVAGALMLASCTKPNNTYKDKQFVMFVDTVNYLAIPEVDTVDFDIPVGVTRSVNYDRTYSVEVVPYEGTAVEGVHFRLMNPNFVVKAGEMSSNVKVRGIYKNIQDIRNPRFTLSLVVPKEEQSEIYGTKTVVEMMRHCGFRMEQWVEDGGNYMFYATFPFSNDMVNFLVKATQLDEKRIELHGVFDDYSTIKMRFDDSDPFAPTVIFPEQYALTTTDYGPIMLRSPKGYPSYYYSCGNFFQAYLDMYVEKVGSFGVYLYLFEKLTQKQADDYANGLGVKEISNNAFGFAARSVDLRNRPSLSSKLRFVE